MKWEFFVLIANPKFKLITVKGRLSSLKYPDIRFSLNQISSMAGGQVPVYVPVIKLSSIAKCKRPAGNEPGSVPLTLLCPIFIKVRASMNAAGSVPESLLSFKFRYRRPSGNFDQLINPFKFLVLQDRYITLCVPSHVTPVE